MGFTRDGNAAALRQGALPRTERMITDEEIPADARRGYHPTMVPAAEGERSDPATEDTHLGAPATDEGALAERLTRDRIHRSLFGELAEAPTIGRYTFLKEIGEGGMGVVCTAYDPKLDRKVAIKLTRSLATATAESRARILREAQAMARLSHPNVVQVYEVGELRDELFVAMEFIDGVDLAAWLADAPRSWREVQRVFLEAGRGLAAAHAVGLVHRDFKPANVFVGADGRVLVGDFGLARASAGPSVDAVGPLPLGPETITTDLKGRLTATGALLGTPAYMAPECFERNVNDAASDQFGFCVALFEALYGVRPFTGRDVGALVRAVLDDAPRVPAGADVPSWLQRVVLRGLEKRPEARWPSMDALLAALAFDPDRRSRGLRRLAVGGAIVAASALGFGWIAAEARARADEEASAKVVAEAARDQAIDGLRAAATRAEGEASRARDALRLAALRRFDKLGTLDHLDDPTSAAALLREVEDPDQVRGWRSSAVEALEEPIARTVLPGYRSVAFTPDGAQLVTENGDDTVSVRRADGTGVAVTFGARADKTGETIGAVALSPDGRRVAIGYRDGLVRLYSIDGAGAPVELRGPGFQVVGLSWDGDSGQLLVSSWDRQQPQVTVIGSQLWDVDDPGAGWRDFPGAATFTPKGGLVITTANSSPYWGPSRHASVYNSDGEMLAEFPGAQRIVGAPAGDAVLVITADTIAMRGLGGASLGAPFGHAALLRGAERVETATFTPNGARVITTTTEDRIFVWDTASAALLRELDAPPRPEAGMLQWGKALAVSPDSALLARSYADRTVRVWDLDGQGAPLVLRGHLHDANALAFAPDSRTLASATTYVRGFSKTEGLQRARGDFEFTLRLWAMPEAQSATFSATAERAATADLHWVTFSPWTPDGRALALREGRTLRLTDPSGALLAPAITLPERYEFLNEPLFPADGGSAIFEAAGHWVRWNLRDPAEIEFIAQPERERDAPGVKREHNAVWAKVSPDGALIYYVSAARDQVRVYDFPGHTLLHELDHGGVVEQIEFSPTGDRLLTVAKDHRVRVWPLASGGPAEEFVAEGDNPLVGRWSPDGAFVAVGVGTEVANEYAFYVWRPGEPGAPELRITTPAVLPLTRVSPDGRHLAILGRDDRLRLVTSAGALEIRELDVVDSEPGRFEFSRDGAWLISRASNAAFIWSTETGAIARVLRSPEQQLTLAAFDPTGTRVLLATRDAMLTVVPFDPAAARADLRGRLREATSYCYSYERRQVDLNEPPALAWANFAACERAYGRTPGEAPEGAG